MLEDVKAVAYDQLCEIESIAPDFDRILFKYAQHSFLTMLCLVILHILFDPHAAILILYTTIGKMFYNSKAVV